MPFFYILHIFGNDNGQGHNGSTMLYFNIICIYSLFRISQSKAIKYLTMQSLQSEVIFFKSPQSEVWNIEVRFLCPARLEKFLINIIIY